MPKTLTAFLIPSELRQAQQVAKSEKELDDFPKLFDRLMEFYASEMPYGTAKARTGDPYVWITEKLETELK